MKLLLVLATIGLLLIGAALQTWWGLGGDLTEYLRYDSSPGQVLYVLSKPCALLAIELVWMQAMLGLLRPRLMLAWGVSPRDWRRTHAAIGAGALTMIVLHVVLFAVATTLRNKAAAFDLFLPWGKGVYRTWVAFGAAALWLMFVGAWAQFATRLQPHVRSGVHKVMLAAVGLVAVHSLNIGTESRAGSMAWAYGVMAMTLLVAGLDRAIGAINRSRVNVAVSAVE